VPNDVPHQQVVLALDFRRGCGGGDTQNIIELRLRHLAPAAATHHARDAGRGAAELRALARLLEDVLVLNLAQLQAFRHRVPRSGGIDGGICCMTKPSGMIQGGMTALQ